MFSRLALQVRLRGPGLVGLKYLGCASVLEVPMLWGDQFTLGPLTK